jgi:hypothetical protein
MIELLYCAAFPVLQIIGLVVIGYVLRVDRKPKGGDSC